VARISLISSDVNNQNPVEEEMNQFPAIEMRVECERVEERLRGMGFERQTGKRPSHFSSALRGLSGIPQIGQVVKIEVSSETKEHVFRVKAVIVKGSSQRGAVAHVTWIVLWCDYFSKFLK
jgi:hypothetical protein